MEVTDQLLDKHQGLIHFVLKRYFSWVPKCDIDDFIQEANIILYKSLQNYDSDFGSISTFAIKSIYFGLKNYVTRNYQKHDNDLLILPPPEHTQPDEERERLVLFCQVCKQANFNGQEFKYWYRRIYKGMGNREQAKRGLLRNPQQANRFRVNGLRKLFNASQPSVLVVRVQTTISVLE